MKMVIIVLLCLASSTSCKAQTTEEWLEQNKIQKKYLLQQIAAFQMYLGYAKTGYSIANKGLNTIQNRKNGDLKLHESFFNSLTIVNPKIRRYTKVAGIISIQISIAKLVQNTIRYCKDSRQVTVVELDYLQDVFNNLLVDCAGNIDQLFSLITDDEADMNDDARIKRIDMLYEEMKDKQVFAQSYSRSAKTFCMRRNVEGMDVEVSRKLQGIK